MLLADEFMGFCSKFMIVKRCIGHMEDNERVKLIE